jgi:flagellar basal-body rod modification protein FlgD
MIAPASEALNKTVSAGKTADNPKQEIRIPAKILDQGDFLKLLVTQLANQDPLAPQTDTAFIAQMAQFTSLEQTKGMTADIAQMRSQQKILQAMSLLDREVVVQSEKTGVAKGIVKGFDMEGSDPKLIIGEDRYDLDDILTIRLANQN